MSAKLSGQTAWISGAASGIGEATARLFVEEGANVVLVDLQDDRGHFHARCARLDRLQCSFAQNTID